VRLRLALELLSTQEWNSRGKEEAVDRWMVSINRSEIERDITLKMVRTGSSAPFIGGNGFTG
jgi:hypothetical protein